MRGWFERKAQKSLVFMCVKELKWHLQQQSSFENSKLLVMSHLVRREITEKIPTFELMILSPYSFSAKELTETYRDIENIRNKKSRLLKKEMQNFQKKVGRIELKFPNHIEQVARNRIRGMEVWMCTLGAGIAPDFRDEIREIWDYLRFAKSSVRSAVDELYDIEQEIEEVTGNSGDSLFQNKHEYWVDLCEFSPLNI